MEMSVTYRLQMIHADEAIDMSMILHDTDWIVHQGDGNRCSDMQAGVEYLNDIFPHFLSNSPKRLKISRK